MVEERRIETKIIDELCKILENSSRFKKVTKGETAIKRQGFKEALEWNGEVAPWAFVVPDIILAWQNLYKESDDTFLISIETKYLNSDSLKEKTHWRRAFREIGQPLRNLLFGYNAVILWHIFSKEVNDQEARKYSEMCNEVIDKLKLPMIYFASKIDSEQFKFYKPWPLESFMDSKYVSDCIYNINLQKDSYVGKVNPILADEKVLHGRKAIKVALNIP